MPTNRDAFQRLVSELDYPMFIVTATADGERAGCLVGFVSQCSITPPRLMVMISKTNHTSHVVANSHELAVHFLRSDNEELAGLFGEETGDQIDKFARCQWILSPRGTPLLSGTRGWVLGAILDRYDAGDHTAHLTEATRTVIDQPGPPLRFETVKTMDPGHSA